MILRKIFKLSFCVLLIVVLVSCSKDDKNGVNKDKRTMSYTVMAILVSESDNI